MDQGARYLVTREEEYSPTSPSKSTATTRDGSSFDVGATVRTLLQQSSESLMIDALEDGSMCHSSGVYSSSSVFASVRLPG